MVFTPENLKRLTNVSVVYYRVNRNVYELAVYPNKLYEYRRNRNTPVRDVVHIEKIYSDVSKGELGRREDIRRDLSEDYGEAIRILLDRGVEKKDKKTREYECGQVRKEVLEHLKERLEHADGRKLRDKDAGAIVKRLAYNIRENREAKVQSLDIIKKILKESADYKRATVSVLISTEDTAAAEQCIQSLESSADTEGEAAHTEAVPGGLKAKVADNLYGPLVKECMQRGWKISIERDERDEQIEEL